MLAELEDYDWEAVYLRKEDVANFLFQLAETEGTDTQKRLEQSAKNILKVGK